MTYELSEVTVVILIGTGLLLTLSVFVLTLLGLSRNRVVAHQSELNRLNEAHQREILQAQLEVQNQTLQHVADELHDHIGQMLSVVWWHLNLLNEETGHTPFENKVAQLLTHTASIVADVRNLSKSLSTDTVARFGLAECVRLELARIDHAGAPPRTQLTVRGDIYSMGPQTEIILLRMVQEALNNALKHAPYAPIRLILDYQPDHLRLTIADEGPGFSLTEIEARALTSSGQGLLNLRRRASLLGGTCTWQTAPGEGTRVLLTIPRDGH